MLPSFVCKPRVSSVLHLKVNTFLVQFHVSPWEMLPDFVPIKIFVTCRGRFPCANIYYHY